MKNVVGVIASIFFVLCIMKTNITKPLLMIIILLGIGSYMLIFEYGTIPKKINDPDYYTGQERFKKLEKNRIFWKINPFDKQISNIEHIIIMICLFLGFLRIIDLIILIQEDKKRYKWAYFLEYLENNQYF